MAHKERNLGEREGEKMPEDTNLENQTPTGNENGNGETTPQQTNGGPSEEWKAKRLEQENAELRERLKAVDERIKSANNTEVTPPANTATGTTEEIESFYREKSADSITNELSKEIEKLPKALQERIKNDPFNPAWLDEKTLEFELYGVDENDPKAKYEAAKRAALKSIPEFVAGFVPEQTPAPEQKGAIGNNPPISQGNAFTGGKDLWQMTDEELIALRNAKIGSTI